MLNAHPDGCCAPDTAATAPLAPVLRRAKLAELDNNLHCSMIGTCLTTGELRKLVSRYAPAPDRKTATGLEIHHTAVELSTLGEAASKEINKALDTRHALAIKRFKAADEAALGAMWREALERGPQAAALPHLHGTCVIYVGGRPQSTLVLARLVAAAGGELLVHDGGIEDRKGMLAAILPRAQLTVFPVDCISHNAMHVTRQLAERNGIPCHPVRTASIASFVELMQRLAA